MKKISFFSVFLLILTLSVLIFPKTAHAELPDTSVNISCLISKDGSNFNSAGSKYNSSTRTLATDYSEFISSSNGAIKFVANTTYSGNELFQPIYEWRVSTDIKAPVISSSSELIIGKNPTNDTNPIISVGDTMIILTIKDAISNASESFICRIQITDNDNLSNIITTYSTLPQTINTSTEDITFNARIPVASNTKIEIKWYIMGPNDTTFNLASIENSYTFKPKELISGYNGYGEYKVMAIGTTSKQKYYSKIYKFVAVEKTTNFGPGVLIIKCSKADNTRASIQAHKYFLTSETIQVKELDFSKIHWYVNNQKVAIGNSFIYEPLTTDTYKVSVKYENGVTPLSQQDPIATIDQTPTATNTYMIFVIIGAIVLVLSVILVVSIKVSNKKRDVVW